MTEIQRWLLKHQDLKYREFMAGLIPNLAKEKFVGVRTPILRKYEKELEEFLPFVDNWAICDQLWPKVFRKHTGELEGKIARWLASERTYTVWFGLGMLGTQQSHSESA